MSKQQHTAEPWHVYDEGDAIEIQNDGPYPIASTTFDHSRDPRREQVLRDYHRIVACVNACAGLNANDLDHIQRTGGIKAMMDRAVLNAAQDAFAAEQRDELLAALRELKTALDPDDWIGEQSMLEFIDTAIAKAEADR